MFRALRIKRARTLTGVIQEWYGSINHLAPGTQSYYRRVSSDFLTFIGDKPIHKITSSEIKQYLQQKLWTLKKSSVNNHVVTLKSFFRWAAESNEIPNPTEKIRVFKPDPFYQPFISKEQYDEILASATSQQKDVIQILAMTGLRASELASLDYENITENFSAIRFTGKGQRQRTIPLNNTVRQILTRHIKAETIINLPKNRKNIYWLCHRAGEKSHIPLAPHMLRRFFATSLAHEGVSVVIISKLLGHSSVRTTEIYLHLDSSYLFGVTDCLD